MICVFIFSFVHVHILTHSQCDYFLPVPLLMPYVRFYVSFPFYLPFMFSDFNYKCLSSHAVTDSSYGYWRDECRRKACRILLMLLHSCQCSCSSDQSLSLNQARMVLLLGWSQPIPIMTLCMHDCRLGPPSSLLDVKVILCLTVAASSQF